MLHRQGCYSTDLEMEDAIKYTHIRRPLVQLLSLVKHQPLAREICGIVEVSYSSARPGIRPTRVRGPPGPRIFSCKCGYLFFAPATRNNGGRIRSRRNRTSKLSGLTQKRPYALANINTS